MKQFSLLCLSVLLLCGLNAQKKGEWTSLFDGKTLAGWRTYQHKPATSWLVSDGTLYCKGNTGAGITHADLITDAEFDSFELELEWKIAPAANSGILYRVTEEYPSSYESGPEYQLIDDEGYPGKLEAWQKTGANYAMNPPLEPAANKAGEWNQTRIIVKGNHVEHWLNNKKVAEYEFHSDAWKQQKMNGKWKNTAGYGMAAKGHIALQDHGGQAWFRNIRIRKL
ncbi:3-keto-disaccharide hydrolase [Sediminibacterium ginsengisoli]|uniref:3-keto-alpha-glucoside-1,2-lyase/3-keto-2-hydroxy-glucal hydratase domain-containing protein n=1 Tax=Sediminibacterium ginsengisoli TaxID=413434 RepID=A0A1T4KYZ4_9BACT|nr:DUF1080 domain-containing protein [Sediminibacterium ginsengisoli]SJZ47672.1 protein of unknown function [Sediminibacterium ginsengisoli]